MDLTKSIDYFNPLDVNGRCHIIGCGSVGSTVASLLARAGVTKITLYDFDVVSSHNIANQMFSAADIGKNKTDSVKELICSINPEAKPDVSIKNNGWKPGTNLSGYVFLCVDNIETRKKIAEENKFNQSIKVMFDFRTRLEEAQHYATEWSSLDEIENFIKSMDFTQEEAVALNPVTACNVEIGVAPTVWIICSYGVSNFMNYIRKKDIKKLIVADAFNFSLLAI